MSKPNSRFEPIVFGFLLTFMMTAFVSAISIFRTTGFVDNFISLWLNAWMLSWAVAFPIVLFVAPLTRKMVARIFKN
ncbi:MULTISPECIES: DUF2798 domain-containing protein [unclassified Lentilitoribacter]|jgi:uncharacterized membrane protein|uniref:DUF2798 domain-containing protein n=1 Tax=unclassified Lentilitoribacter TaxID=2647570 RepID=UPI0013A6F1C2|nr:DUF2798 domain-containing protein [Lentilitoribacter sp. Alg239-R112]